MMAQWVVPETPARVEAVAALPGRLLGLDAGGSGTRGLVVEAGEVVAAFTVEGMNALLTSDVVGRLSDLGRQYRAAAMGVGMPGARTEADTGRLGAELTRYLGAPVTVAPDVDVVRMGAFLGAPGIVVAAGTGTVALGSDGRRRVRAGGHGFLLGDEGGAYWLGREAVRAALRCADRGEMSPLVEAVTAAAGASLEELVRQVHGQPSDRHLLARLAPVVSDLSRSDPDARAIVVAAADYLVDLVAAVRVQLGELPVAAAGGVFASEPIRDRFVAVTGARPPLAPPTVGAVLLAGRALEKRRNGDNG